MKIRYRKDCNRGYEDKTYEVLHITNTFSFSHQINRFRVPVGNFPTATYFLVASDNGSFFWIADYDCELVREEGMRYDIK